MRLFRAEQVAVILQIPKGRVYELARRKIIPSVSIGRLVRFDEDALVAWVSKGGTLLPEAADEASALSRPNLPATSTRRSHET